MVFTTVINYVRSRGPDELWRKRRIFKLAAVFKNSSYFIFFFNKLVSSTLLVEEGIATV